VIVKTELVRKLSALSTSATTLKDGNRVLSNGTWPQPLRAILSEIDDTVLKRKLTFISGANHISVVASGRRLLAVVEVSENFATGSELVGQALSSTRTDLVNSVAVLLTELAQRDGNLLVTAGSTELLDSQTEGGVPILMLADALGIDVDDTTEGPLGKFLEAIEGLMAACIFYTDGAEVSAAGDDGDISMVRSELGAHWHEFRTELPFLRQDEHSPFLICLAGTGGGSGSLFVAEGGESRAAFSTTDDDTAAIQASWGDYFVA